MKFLIVFFFTLLTQLVWANSNQEKLAKITSVQSIAFGSCNRHWLEQPLWQDLIRVSPDLFIWGGDNVYANTHDPLEIRAAYEIQNRVPDYRAFKELTPIVGIWDDHDFGMTNNGNGHYEHKDLSQEFMLDFLEEPFLSPRRQQKGIYTSYELGEAGKRVKVILLDNRYFKDLDPESRLLGKTQWNWLEAELRNSKADVHLLVTGLSILSPKTPASEEWADYPEELTRLEILVNTYNPKGLMILSGDKHFSSIIQKRGFVEFMSSGMTHTTKLPLRPYIMQTYDNYFFGLSYGLVEFDWTHKNPTLTLTVRSTTDENFLQRTFRWSERTWIEL